MNPLVSGLKGTLRVVFALAILLGPSVQAFAKPSRVPLKEEYRSQIASSRTIVTLYQTGLDTDFQKFRWGSPFGLIGGLLKSAGSQDQREQAKAHLASIQKSLADYDAGKTFREALAKELGPLSWIKGNSLGVQFPKEDAPLEELINACSEDIVLLVSPYYALSPDYQSLNLSATVSLHPRSGPLLGKRVAVTGLPDCIYENEIMIIRHLFNWPSEKPEISAAASTLAEDNAKRVREALDAGLGELAAMIAADLELPGPVDDAFYYKTPKGARRINTKESEIQKGGYVVREHQGYNWIRAEGGLLYSQLNRK